MEFQRSDAPQHVEHRAPSSCSRERRSRIGDRRSLEPEEAVWVSFHTHRESLWRYHRERGFLGESSLQALVPLKRMRVHVNFPKENRMNTASGSQSNNSGSVRSNTSTRRRLRRGAITHKNARRIQGQFQKPPLHPKRSPNRRGPVYENNHNIRNLSINEINLLLNRMG